MRKLKSILLYTALGLLANIGHAETADLEALRVGDMRKLVFHSEAIAGTDVAFLSKDGTEMTLADFNGKYIALNFWATWCAPCRKEMPELSALQSTMGRDDFAVVTIATGPNTPAKIAAFFDDIQIDNLPAHRDPRQALAREMGVLGLPVTVVLDRDGQEIARLLGDANWHSDSALAIMRALIAP